MSWCIGSVVAEGGGGEKEVIEGGGGEIEDGC